MTDEEKTHKNPALKATGPVAASATPAAAPVTKQGRTELDGRRWNVEHHKDNREIVIEETEANQSVYVFKCEGCTLQIRGKVNNIVLDQCRKTGLLFHSAVSGVELVNCQSVQVQVRQLNA